MKTEIKVKQQQNEDLQLGDVIGWDGKLYLVTRFNGQQANGWTAKSFNGESGLFGSFDSLEEMNTEWHDRHTATGSTLRTATLYKANKYKLQLVEV